LPCSALLTPSLASTDLRSAAVLARKEEIELVSPDSPGPRHAGTWNWPWGGGPPQGPL